MLDRPERSINPPSQYSPAVEAAREKQMRQAAEDSITAKNTVTNNDNNNNNNSEVDDDDGDEVETSPYKDYTKEQMEAENMEYTLVKSSPLPSRPLDSSTSSSTSSIIPAGLLNVPSTASAMSSSPAQIAQTPIALPSLMSFQPVLDTNFILSPDITLSFQAPLSRAIPVHVPEGNLQASSAETISTIDAKLGELTTQVTNSLASTRLEDFLQSIQSTILSLKKDVDSVKEKLNSEEAKRVSNKEPKTEDVLKQLEHQYSRETVPSMPCLLGETEDGLVSDKFKDVECLAQFFLAVVSNCGSRWVHKYLNDEEEQERAFILLGSKLGIPLTWLQQKWKTRDKNHQYRPGKRQREGAPSTSSRKRRKMSNSNDKRKDPMEGEDSE